MHAFFNVVVEYEGLLQAYQRLHQTAHRARLEILASVPVDIIIEELRLAFEVKRSDDGRLRAEQVADLIADEIIDGLQFQFGRETILHAFDDGKFRLALLQFFKNL